MKLSELSPTTPLWTLHAALSYFFTPVYEGSEKNTSYYGTVRELTIDIQNHPMDFPHGLPEQLGNFFLRHVADTKYRVRKFSSWSDS